MESLMDLYLEQLRDIYSAEKQLVSTLPKMADAATAPTLKQAFRDHLDQTKMHVERLEQIFRSISANPNGETCEAMEGLVKEGNDIINKNGTPSVKDAALIAAAQRIEHYEIAAYGTVSEFARQLSHHQAKQLLDQTLQEEKNTDRKLTNMAVTEINPGLRRFSGIESVVALFDNFNSARAAIEAMVDDGFDPHHIGMITRDMDREFRAYMRQLQIDNGPDDTLDDVDAEEGATFGAIIGALAGVGVAVIPGLGGFVVAGVAGAALFAALGGMLGAATGGFTAGLIELGIEQNRANWYQERIRAGHTLVVARVPEEWIERIEAILERFDPVEVEEVDQS